jgi:hypothetical protein
MSRIPSPIICQLTEIWTSKPKKSTPKEAADILLPLAGLKPLGLKPVGLKPLGLKPVGLKPLGLKPVGLKPLGLEWLGLVGLR